MKQSPGKIPDFGLPLYQNYDDDKHYKKTQESRSRSGSFSSSHSGRGGSRSSPRTSSSALPMMDAKARLYLMRFFATGHTLQVLLLFVITGLVLHSHSRANYTADTLRRVQQQESLSLLQLQKIERSSLQLHESIRGRLHRAGVLEEHEEDPLEPQHRQLVTMTDELNSQVRTLQERIQMAAREQIVMAYGEGPVKVVIELDFDARDTTSGDGDPAATTPQQAAFVSDAVAATKRNHIHHVPRLSKGSYISILLWPDTPHAAWAWLEQIGRDVWEGAGLEWDPSGTRLKFKPTNPDPLERGMLEFVEQPHPKDEIAHPDMRHGAWTVGLREVKGTSTGRGIKGKTSSGSTANNPGSNSRLEMFINLADNHETNKHESCVGRILDGFDALQRLLESTRMAKKGNGQRHKAVTVKRVFAGHIHHRELKHVYEGQRAGWMDTASRT